MEVSIRNMRKDKFGVPYLSGLRQLCANKSSVEMTAEIWETNRKFCQHNLNWDGVDRDNHLRISKVYDVLLTKLKKIEFEVWPGVNRP